jgi:hypothetical protein
VIQFKTGNYSPSPAGRTSDAGTVAKLADDAHFPGSILANANWLVPILEFPPAPLPINHRHKTGECGSHRLRVAVLYPDTEPCVMFSFIDAGSWFTHFVGSSGAALALSPAHRHCPSEEALETGSPAMTCGTKGNWESKHLAKIARRLRTKFRWLRPFSFQTCATLCTACASCEPSGSGTTGDSVTERNHFAQRNFRTS